MTAHEAERLSAFLDGELSPAERRAVEAHLQACPDCQARLAALRGVDAAARDLPVATPAGYFDDFAARVRSRIEADGVARARRAPSVSGWRWPLWAGAAAAALVLSIVVPRTLERSPGATRPDDLARPAVAPAAPAALESAPEATATPGLATPPAPARNARARDEVGLARSAASEPPAGSGAAAEKKESREEVPPPAPRAARPVPPPSAPLVPPAAEGGGADDNEGFAAAPTRDQPSPAKPVGKVLDTRTADRDDAPADLAKSRARAIEAGAASEADEAREAERPAAIAEERVVAAQETSGRAATPGDEVAYRRLAASAPEGAEGWRERREEWRAFALAHPTSPRADEARVRVIEAGVAAWRAGGRAEDLARAREDLEAYVSRGDARLKDRARRAVESAAPR